MFLVSILNALPLQVSQRVSGIAALQNSLVQERNRKKQFSRFDNLRYGNATPEVHGGWDNKGNEKSFKRPMACGPM